MKRLVPLVAVLITRDAMTILPSEVPEHELPVTQAVFGEDNVEVKGTSEDRVVVLDSTQEAERLAGKYGAEALELAYGVNFKGAIAKACAAAGTAAPDEEGEAEGKALADMTKAELLAHATAHGVTVDAAATKAKILEAIQAAA